MPDSEFALIQDYFTGGGEGPAVRLGIGDDAAALAVPEGHVLQISTDTAVEGVHFLATLSPTEVAYRSVMAAASDLAAMGASPLACLLSLTLPESEPNWLQAFSSGLSEACEQTGLSLVGGDTTRGPLSITVTVMGSTPAGQFMTRSGAQPGDRLCVSGHLGDAAAGLAISKGELAVDDARNQGLLVGRYERPTARWRWVRHSGTVPRLVSIYPTGCWPMRGMSLRRVVSLSTSIAPRCRSQKRSGLRCRCRRLRIGRWRAAMIMNSYSLCPMTCRCQRAVLKSVVFMREAG